MSLFYTGQPGECKVVSCLSAANVKYAFGPTYKTDGCGWLQSPAPFPAFYFPLCSHFHPPLSCPIHCQEVLAPQDQFITAGYSQRLAAAAAAAAVFNSEWSYFKERELSRQTEKEPWCCFGIIGSLRPRLCAAAELLKARLTSPVNQDLFSRKCQRLDVGAHTPSATEPIPKRQASVQVILFPSEDAWCMHNSMDSTSTQSVTLIQPGIACSGTDEIHCLVFVCVWFFKKLFGTFNFFILSFY